MLDLPVTREDVVAWINQSLADYQGLYEVQDLTFIRSAVRVVTLRRDALFDVTRTRWPELADPQSRPGITEDLRLWARRNLKSL